MKLRTALFVGVIGMVPMSAWAQGISDPRLDMPKVHVGLFRYHDDGRVGGSASSTADRVGEDLDGTVWVAPCMSMGAANPDRAFSAAATDVWKLTGAVQELSAEQATFRISWQRVRKDGQEEQTAPQSVTLTLKRGERTTLETFSRPARGSCDVFNVTLEATFISTREMFPRNLGSGTGSGLGGGVGIGSGGSSGSGGGSGGGGGSSARAGSTGSRGSGGGGGVVISQMMKNGRPMLPRVTADLWLVRTSPGRPDETLHLTSLVVPAPTPFAFAPLAIQTASGAFTVKVEGTIESGFTPAGEAQLYFSANRTTSFAPTTRAARDTAPTVEGSTKTSVPMPGNDDVLSFEMPPLKTPSGAVVPDTLSVRVKVTRDPQ